MPTSLRVAVVLATFTEPGRAVLRGVAAYAERARNWELYTGSLPSVDAGSLRQAFRADGLITWLFDDDFSDLLGQASVPIVAVHYGGSLRLPNVTDNNERIVELAAEHFF